MLNFALIFELALVVIIIAVLIWQFKKPTMLKWAIAKIDTTPTYDMIASEGKTVTDFKNYTIWSKEGNKKCIIFVVGGAFLYSDRTTSYGFMNKLSELMPDYDVISVSYPIRFASTFHQMLIGMNDTLAEFAGKYEDYHVVAFSAGVMLTNTFMNKEEDANAAKLLDVPQIGLKFKSATLICGIFYTGLWSGLANWLFKKYIINGITHPECCNAMYVQHNNPYYVISSSANFLHNQSLQFISRNSNVKSLIFEQPYMTHGFIQIVNLEETQQAIESIAEFIKDNETV